MKYFDALLAEIRPRARPGAAAPTGGAQPPSEPPKAVEDARTGGPGGPPEPPKGGGPGHRETSAGFGGDPGRPIPYPGVALSPASPTTAFGGSGGGPGPTTRRPQPATAVERSAASSVTAPTTPPPSTRSGASRPPSGRSLGWRPAPIRHPILIRAENRPRTLPADKSGAAPATKPDLGRPDALGLPPAWDNRGFAEAKLGDRIVPYFIWDGRALTGDVLGFDTETALIVEGEVPPLALASASSGSEHCLIHPDRLGEFVRLHGDRHLVFHNVAFDVWVVAEHLAMRGEVEALETWWRVADADRMHDTMLLDELIRLARSDDHPRPRNLAEVAAEYAGLELDKDDPYRLRYGEIIGKDWAGVGRGFFEYAVKDPIATLAAYTAMRQEALEHMEAHGHDPSRRG